MKKILYVILCIAMVLSNVSFVLYAENSVIWEDNNIKLIFEEETGTLTVTGQGETADYEELGMGSGPNISPICHNTKIKHVIIEEGITYIGSCFFNDCISIESVKFPSSLKEIGFCAFEGCSNITSVEFPEGIKKLNYTGIGIDVGGKNNLKDIRFYGNVPDIEGSGLFYSFIGTVYYPKDNPTWTKDLMESINAQKNHSIKWEVWDAPKIKSAENKFIDIIPDAWYIDAVQYVYHNSIMSGNDNAEFLPDGKLTREQLVQVFFAMEKLDKNDYVGDTGFSDVPVNEWYSSAVKWAKAEGITDGIGEGVFGLGGYVSREQLATFIMNYIGFKNGDLSGDGDLSGFTDADMISEWAVTGMKYCVANGIINGRSNTVLDPLTPAVRSELAQMLKQL